MLKSIYLIT